MPDKQQIEIEVVLRDAMSAGLKEIVRELDAQNRKVMETAGASASGLKNLGAGLSQLGKKGHVANESFNIFDKALKTLTTGALSPVGIVAGIVGTGVALGNSIGKFAAHNQAYADLAENAGVTERQFRILTQALRRGGLAPEEAVKKIESFGGALQDMELRGTQSGLFQALELTDPSNQPLIDSMLELTRANKIYDSLLVLLQIYQRSGQIDRQRIASSIGLDLSDFEDMIQFIPMYKEEIIPDLERSQRITDEIVDLTVKIRDAFKLAANAANEGLTKALEAFTAMVAPEQPDILDALGLPSNVNLGLRVIYSIPALIGGFGYGAGRRAIYGPEKPPEHAEGGIVGLRGPEIVSVGERGPEYVVALDPLASMGGRLPESMLDVFAKEIDKVLKSKLVEDFAEPGKEVWEGNPWPALAKGLAGTATAAPVMGGGFLSSLLTRLLGGAAQLGKDIQKELHLEQTQQINVKTLGDIRTTLLRIENPLGQKKFAMGSGGKLMSDTKARVAELEAEDVTLPDGTTVRVRKPTSTTLPAGSEVRTLAQSRQMAAIRAIGRSESSFSRKEAYSEYLNAPSRNANVRKYGQRGADYGFFQMNELDVSEGIRLGMDPAVARHLHGGGKGGTSSVEEQSAAVLEYTKLRFPKQFQHLAETGDFESFRKSAVGHKWFGLGRDKGKEAKAEYSRALAAFKPAHEESQYARADAHGDVDRAVIDNALTNVGFRKRKDNSLDVDIDFEGLHERKGDPGLRPVSINGPRPMAVPSTLQHKQAWG